MRFIYLLLLSLSSLLLNAQRFQWVVNGSNGGGTDDTIYSGMKVSVDQNDNVYHFDTYSTVRAMGGAQTNEPNRALALSSYKADGSFRFLRRMGSPGTREYANGLNVSQDGGVYVSIYASRYSEGMLISDDTVFQGSAFNNIGTDRRRVFLVKYDTAGVFQWVRTPEADTVAYYHNHSVGYGIQTDSQGNVHWLCQLTKGSLGGTPHEVTQSGLYVVRYSSSGQLLGRVKLAGHMNFPYRLDFSTMGFTSFRYDENNRRYLLGGVLPVRWAPPRVHNSITFGTTSIQTGEIYLVAYKQNGVLDWVRKSYGISNGRIVELLVDSVGDIFIGGDISLGRSILDSIIAPPGTAYHGFILRLDKDGVLKKLRLFGFREMGGMALNEKRQEVLACFRVNSISFNEPFDYPKTLHRSSMSGGFIRLDMNDFRVVGADGNYSQMYNPNVFLASAIAVNSRNEIYLSGQTSSITCFSDTTLLSVNRAPYLTKYACDPLEAQINISLNSSISQYSFRYNGTKADSVVWSFGDGRIAVGDTVEHVYWTAGTVNVCAQVYNRFCGDTTLCKSIVVTALGEEEGEVLTALSLYPNPFQSGFSLELPVSISAGSSVELSLYSISGQRYYHQVQAATPQMHINAPTLAPGLYLFELKTPSGQVFYQKVLKQ